MEKNFGNKTTILKTIQAYNSDCSFQPFQLKSKVTTVLTIIFLSTKTHRKTFVRSFVNPSPRLAP
jgi:hypothetical protein